MRDYLHVATNKRAGFIKVDTVDKGLPHFSRSAIEGKWDELVLRLVYRFRFGNSEQRAKAWVRSKAWMGRGACVFWKIKASSGNDANPGKPAASWLFRSGAR